MIPNTSPILLFYFLSLWLSSGSGTPFAGQHQQQRSNLNSFPVYHVPFLRPSSREATRQSSLLPFGSSSSPSSSSSSSSSSSLQGSPEQESREGAATYPLYSPVFFDPLRSPSLSYSIPQSVIRSEWERLPQVSTFTFPGIKRRSSMIKTTNNWARRLAAGGGVNREGNMIDPNHNSGNSNNKSHRNGTRYQEKGKGDMINSWHGERKDEKNPVFTSPTNRRPTTFSFSNTDEKDSQSVREYGMDRRGREQEHHQSSSVVADLKRNPSPEQLRSAGKHQPQRISSSPAANSKRSPSQSAIPPFLATSGPSLASSLKSAPYQFMDLIPSRKTRESRLFDVPQVECPPSDDEVDNFACPSPDSQGRYRCIGSHALCDGFRDCPKGEDEDRKSCLFYKSVSHD